MRNRLIAGLFTTAVLFFAAPVAAEEHFPQHRSLTADIEEIQDMVKRSQERQGYVHNTQEVESEPITPTSSQAEEPEDVIEPISEPITTPEPVSTVTEQVQVAPVTLTKSAASSTSTGSAQSSAKVLDKSTFHNHSAQSTTSDTPVSSTFSANQATSAKAHSQKEVHQSSQQIAVRHANQHRHQSASDEPPSTINRINQEEPTREQQLKHKGFMLFAADLAWERVDTKHDYALGARLERGVISPLSAIRVYAPDKLPEALAILAGQKEYT